MRLPIALAALAAFAAPASAQPSAPPPDVVALPEAQEDVAVTVYNGGFGLVREVRTVRLDGGLNGVRWEGVPSGIDPTSLSIQSLTRPGALTVREQNYQANLIGTRSVLDAAVGQPIRLVRRLGSEVVIESGVLISQPGQGRIVRLDDGRVLVDPEGTIELAALPGDLRSRPSLLWRLAAARGGEHRVEARYMTEGLRWEAAYVAVLADGEASLDLTGWVTLENRSGAAYRDAQLQLVAGDVRRVQPRRRAVPEPVFAAADARGAAPQFEQESFFEYHLYSLDGRTTLGENETKQMQLLGAEGVGVSRRLVFDGTGQFFPFGRARRPGAGGATNEVAAAVVVEMENARSNGLGRPLPAGTVRVYRADGQGRLQFVGEDRIGHTPRGETVRLYVGDAFDVVGTRRQVSDRRLSDRLREVTVEVEVRNRKEEPAEVAVVERLFGDWEITDSTHEFERLDARTAEFTLDLAAGETATVRYTARMRF